MAAWVCATCGAEHVDLSTVLGPNAPDSWFVANEEERDDGEIDGDLCFLTVDGAPVYAIRGHIELPIVDRPGEVFVWSVWCTLSEADMRLTLARWTDEDRADLPPMIGLLNNLLPYEPDTFNLPATVHTRGLGLVPLIVIDPTLDHPLVDAQRHGITWHQVAIFNERLVGKVAPD